MSNTLAGMAKALTAALVAGIGATATAAVDDTITLGEWWAAAAAAAAALGAVYRIPNRPPDDYTPRHDTR